METLKKFLSDSKGKNVLTATIRSVKPLLLVALLSVVFLSSCAVGNNPSNAHKKPPVINRH